jgi:thiamine pyrophosphate-dependent acetolactate synthase large subunit-like protein
MNILSACGVISRARGDAVLVATMGAMVAFDKLGAGQPRLSSVPLMGGAPSLGLGIALAKPQCKVVVVDGDASLLMQLGGLVTVAGQLPRNFFHFVIHNGTQFTGMSNLPVPGERPVDFAGMARCAGYANAQKITELDALEEDIERILAGIGPTFIELEIEPDAASLTVSNPQKDWADLQFTRMGDEARQLTKWLESK